MRKYLLSTIAIVLAIICFSFTRPKTNQKSFDYVYLVYTSSQYTSSAVRNVNNWVEDDYYSPSYDCYDAGDEKACAIATSSVYLTGSYPSRKPNDFYIQISAVSTVPGYYYPVEAYGSAAFDTYNVIVP